MINNGGMIPAKKKVAPQNNINLIPDYAADTELESFRFDSVEYYWNDTIRSYLGIYSDIMPDSTHFMLGRFEK